MGAGTLSLGLILSGVTGSGTEFSLPSMPAPAPKVQATPVAKKVSEPKAPSAIDIKKAELDAARKARYEAKRAEQEAKAAANKAALAEKAAQKKTAEVQEADPFGKFGNMTRLVQRFHSRVVLIL